MSSNAKASGGTSLALAGKEKQNKMQQLSAIFTGIQIKGLKHIQNIWPAKETRTKGKKDTNA